MQDVVGRSRGRVGALIWTNWRAVLLVLLGVVVAFAWSVGSAPGSAPDEVWHLENIWCVGGPAPGQCESLPGDAVRGPASIVRLDCAAHKPTDSAACINTDVPPDGTLAVFPTTGDGIWGGVVPKGYYRVASLFVVSDPVVTVIMVRFANALLCLALLVTTAALVEGGVRRALIGAWIVGVVPLGLFTVASVSNSSWTTTGVGIAWAAALGAAEARSRRRALALVAITVVCVALAIGSRGDGAAFALVSVALGLAVSDRVRHALARRLWPLVGIGALAVAAVAGLTAAMARVQFGYVFDPVVYFFANAWSQPDLLLPNLVEIPQLWAGAFGSWGVSWGIGAGDVPLPAVVGVLMLLSVGFLVSAGLQAMWRAKGVALLILAALLWFVPLVFLQNVGVQVGEWVQPRYLLPLILVGLGLALTPHARAALTVNRTQWLVLAATVSIAQAVALHRLIRRYVTGVDVTSWNLDRSVEWWWSWLPPPMIIWALGSIAFAALAFLGLRVALHPAGTRAESP